MNNKIEWIKAILILPFNAIVIIPLIFLFFSNYQYQAVDLGRAVIGTLLLLSGIFFALWSMGLFATKGNGTPAPWAPPQNLVKDGPYKLCRNPMLTGVILILAAEAVILNSKALYLWAILFFIINNIYFEFYEEKKLEERFGSEYTDYKNKTPRWFFRF